QTRRPHRARGVQRGERSAAALRLPDEAVGVSDEAKLAEAPLPAVPDMPPPPAADTVPGVVDRVAMARLYGEPLFALPTDLYIPPDALEVFLEAFEGPLDLLLYLIRRQ